MGYEEHIPGQTRDWNEELQSTRELPRKNLPERLIRERAIFKIHSDFVMAATRAAIAVIDGNVMAINPGESSKMQMFIWNNIFFSLGFDVKDHYKDFGGDHAAYVAPANDLHGVKAYASVDPENLYVLGTVIVDYRGYRVTAQSIIPGILEKEQEQSVVYGSIDFGKTIVTNEKYTELLKSTASQLKIRPHRVLNEKGEEIEIFSSVECKGIIGNDSRYYVLDLLRTFPPDVNFLPIEGEELSSAMKEFGFPVAHQHKMVCLRQELIESFVETKYIAFIKHAAYQFQTLRVKNLIDKKEEDKNKEASENNEESDGSEKKDAAEKTEGEDKKKDDEVEEAKKLIEEMIDNKEPNKLKDHSKEIVAKAAEAIGSLDDGSFNVSFNPDVFQPSVTHACKVEYEKDKKLVKEACEYLVLHQIPSLIAECIEHQQTPVDGVTLSEAFHQKGINMRYLGKFAEIVGKQPTLTYLYTISVTEIIVRCMKHIFKQYMQDVEMMSLSAAISHFLNCFLSSSSTLYVQIAPEDLQGKHNKKKNKRKARHLPLPSQETVEWASEGQKSLWKKVKEEAKAYYLFDLEAESVDAAVEKYACQKICLFRAFCKQCGIQVLLRDYSFDAKNKQAFFEEDILNMFPIVKHIHPKATDAYNFFTSGQNKIQQGFLREGHELISEALNLLNNVYGPMHAEIGACNKLLARLNYIMGEHAGALMFQQRAVMISERVLGVDHPSTITEYSHLALYCYANGQVSNALKLLYRARYLALVCCGENHPEVALIDSNIGLILHAVGEFNHALKFLEKSLELNSIFFGLKSLKAALSHHLVARVHSCRGDYRAAFNSEREAYNIYKEQLGDTHDRTRESAECMKHLTKQMITIQKRLEEINRGDKNAQMPPLQIQAPSFGSVLETLNIINGIVFVQLSPSEIEKIRVQMAQDHLNAQPSEILVDEPIDGDDDVKNVNGDDSTKIEIEASR